MERKKVSWEKQAENVERYLRGEVGYLESVKAANNSKSSFRRWVAQYRKGGPSALLPPKKKNTYPASSAATLMTLLSFTPSLPKRFISVAPISFHFFSAFPVRFSERAHNRHFFFVSWFFLENLVDILEQRVYNI